MFDFIFYKKEIKTKGLYFFVNARFNKLYYLWVYFLKKIKKEKFYFDGKQYEYLINKYNFAWQNERSVEVPIAYSEFEKINSKDILEVGNVLSHYYPVKHDIVDKYEIDKKVINSDIVKFKSKKKYKLIISISTLEHVGWEETPKDTKKIIKALKNMKSLLAPGGKVFITLPIGYTNPWLNNMIYNQKLNFAKTYYLKRVSKNNTWVQTTSSEINKSKYNHPYPNANAILVGIAYS